MASAVAHPEALLERLDIAGSDESSEAAERKRPAVANLGLPTSITNVAADNFLYWTLSDLIDDHPEDTKIEVPVEDELALEIAGVGLKVVKDKSNPEDEDYVPADRKTKVDTLVCLRKTLVLHEGEHKVEAIPTRSPLRPTQTTRCGTARLKPNGPHWLPRSGATLTRPASSCKAGSMLPAIPHCHLDPSLARRTST